MDCAGGHRERKCMTMREIIAKRVAGLLTVKSLVTLTLTVIFGILTYRGEVDQNFMTIYTVVVSFYFGVQTAKSGGGAE